MGARELEPGAAEAVLWQTLAQAFLPPLRADAALAFAECLAPDLAELAVVLGPEADDDIARLAASTGEFADPTALLLEYSRLFLPPAAAATLNLSRYVDSGVCGPCMDALEFAYRAHGLECSDGLHDFADHAARQFEFLGFLSESGDSRAAGEFARLCLVGALPRLAAQLSQCAPASPYTALARVAARALRRHAAPVQAPPDKPSHRHDLTRGVWRHCAGCGKAYAREKEIGIMTAALHKAGLPAEHLAKCPACRDRAQGFFRRGIA